MINNNKNSKIIENVNEELKPITNEELEALGFEVAYNEPKFKINIDGLETYNINELDVGATCDGKPEFALFDNSKEKNNDGSPRKWDSLVFHLVDAEMDETGQYTGDCVICNIVCPRPDENGYIKNVFAKGFYHNLFCLLYSYRRCFGEEYVLDEKGNIINVIEKVNIQKVVETLNMKEKMEIKIVDGADKDEYHAFMITDMK